MDSTIRQFPKDSDEHLRLEMACLALNHKSTKGTTYKVEDTYFDFGQGWMWTTIIAYRADGEGYQALCPLFQEWILTEPDTLETVSIIPSHRYWYEL